MGDDVPLPAAPPAAPLPTLLMSPDGDVYKFADPTRALAAGYRPLTPEEAIRHQVEKEEAEKGVVGSLEAAGKSALNQALLGVPGALSEAGETPEERTAREAREEFHSTARILGGAAGIGASLLAGGPLFKGAELAGEAVSHAVAPAAELAGASLGSKLAATAANYATQGAALAAPQAIVQAAFGDPTQAAETLLWGVGAGAALGGAGELLSSGAEGATSALERVLGRDDVSERLGKFASDRTAKAFGAERSQLNKLSPERIRDVTDFAHEEGLIRPGMTREELGAAVDAAHEKYGTQLGDVLNSLDGLAQKGTTAEDLATHALKPGELGDKIKAALDTPEMRMPMNADQRKALETVVESAHLIPTTKVNGQDVVSFQDAQDFVSSLRRKWVGAITKAQNEGGVRGVETVTPLDQMKGAAYQVARDAVHQAGDRVALAANEPELVGALARAKAAYSKVATLDQWAATLERQAAGNRAVSLTDFIHAGQGLGTGAMQTLGAGIGGLLGGAPGAAAGAMVGKLPGTLLDFVSKKWAEDKGLVYLSAIAHRAAKEGPEVFSAVMASEGAKRLAATMSGVQDTVRRLALEGIGDTKARTSEHMKHLLGETTGLSKDQQYAKLGGRLTQLAANPAAMAQVTSALSAPYATTAPAVADAYQQKLAATLTYLYQALPKPPGPPPPFAPQSWAPSAQDKLAFHDRAEIIANPMRAMAHVEQGTLSPAHVETLQTIYPVVYGMMKQQILQFHAEHPDVLLPMRERQSIATFLGQPLGTMEEHVGALQKSYAPAPSGPSAPGPGPQRARVGSMGKGPSYATTYGQTQGPKEAA